MAPIRKTSLSVLLTHISFVPITGAYVGGPVTRMSSAGVVLTKTFGTLAADSERPGNAAFTSFQLSSAGRFLNAAGSVPAGFHGPLRSVAVSQLSLLRRKYAFDGLY